MRLLSSLVAAVSSIVLNGARADVARPSRKTPSSLVLNENPAGKGKGSFSTLSFNIDTPRVRYEMLEGRKHMVVPAVALTRGVHNGSAGPLLYTDEELGKTPVSWDGKPVCVQHPTMNGKPISACDPIIFNTSKIGLMFNTRYDLGTGKLHTEAWLDPEKTAKVDPAIISNIESGKITELSTGLFTDNEPAPENSVWNGEKFTHVAKNFRPDHLAILPDRRGACSIADGAGLLRNEGGMKCADCKKAFPAGTTKCPDCGAKLVGNMSHDDIANGLRSALDKKHGKYEASIEAVFPDAVVHKGGGSDYSKSFHQKYKVGEHGVELEGEPTEVARKVSYHDKATGAVVQNAIEGAGDSSDAWAYDSISKKAVEDSAKLEADIQATAKKVKKAPQETRQDQIFAGSYQAQNPLLAPGAITNDNPKEKVTMNKAQIILALIANSGGVFSEKDRPKLEAMEENQLKLLAGLKVLPGATAPTPAANKEEEISPDSEEEQENLGRKTGASKGGKPQKPRMLKPADVEDLKNAPAAEEGGEGDAGAIKNEDEEAREYGRKMLRINKDRLVKTIVSNKANSFNEDWLRAQKMEMLEALAKLGGTKQPNFSALGEPATFNTPGGPTANAPKPLVREKIDFKAAVAKN